MRFARALSLVRYNWPLYAICLGTIACGIVVTLISSLPVAFRVIACSASVIAAWYAVASFLAFHMMFDRPELLSGSWLHRCVADPPKSCTQISVCVEETTLPIESLFPTAHCTNLDLFDDSVMTGPAITRAKKGKETGSVVTRASPDHLPLKDKSTELTIVTLAAHEVRDQRLRQKLFKELARITEDHGRVVIVEHLRNVPAALAFGPGLFHFYPRSTWIELAASTGLNVESEFDVTPFVHVFVLKHHNTDSAGFTA